MFSNESYHLPRMYYSVTFPENMWVIYFNYTVFSPTGQNSVYLFTWEKFKTNKKSKSDSSNRTPSRYVNYNDIASYSICSVVLMLSFNIEIGLWLAHCSLSSCFWMTVIVKLNHNGVFFFYFILFVCWKNCPIKKSKEYWQKLFPKQFTHHSPVMFSFLMYYLLLLTRLHCINILFKSNWG